MTTLITGVLQIDHERGVIYFHADGESITAGACPTPLRICGLAYVKIPHPLEDRQLDITVSSQMAYHKDTMQLMEFKKVGITK